MPSSNAQLSAAFRNVSENYEEWNDRSDFSALFFTIFHHFFRSMSSFASLFSIAERVTLAWIDNEIDDDSYSRLRSAYPEIMLDALERVGVEIEIEALENEIYSLGK